MTLGDVYGMQVGLNINLGVDLRKQHAGPKGQPIAVWR